MDIEQIKNLKQSVINGGSISKNDALLLANTNNKTEFYKAANEIREQLKGNAFDICSIENAKSGACSEDCKWCSQSAHNNSKVDVYEMVDSKKAVEMAKRNENYGVKRYSLVTSGRTVSNKNIDNQIDIQRNVLELIKKVPAITKKEFREYKKEAMFIGIFANAIVFVIIANILNLDDMIFYYKEIMIIFIITTIIRYGSILTLIKVFNLPSRWIQALTLAGSKGALAIIMSHSLPNTFIYKEMFISIVIGNVILSTFIYTILLMIHIAKYTQAYKQDIITFDETKMTQDDYNRCLIDVIEKDTITNAYNKSFIEDILLHEMARSQRYKIDLSLLCIEIPYDTKDDILKMIGINVLERIRVNDYFGKISEVRYIIITSNTSLSGAIVLAEKLLLDIEEKNPIKLFCGVTEISDSDTMDSVFDKIDDALSRAILKDGQQIEVEV